MADIMGCLAFSITEKDCQQRPSSLISQTKEPLTRDMIRATRLLLLLLAIFATIGLAYGADQNPIIIERDVAVKMRDGVILRADIYRPNAEGKFPVILQRRYYDKRTIIDFGYTAAA